MALLLPPVWLLSCANDAPKQEVDLDEQRAPPTAEAGLRNVLELENGVIVGSTPRRDGGYEALGGMDVRTIVSVSGAAPDVESAQAEGMRYVHVPVKYSGVEEDERRRLAVAFRDMDRPIYVHCFDGVDRAPAGTAVGLIGAGRMTRDEGVRLLETAGTPEAFPGLHTSVAEATPVVDDEQYREMRGASLPAVAEVPEIASSMAEISRAWYRLEVLRYNGWSAPVERPGLLAQAEATRINEALKRVRALASTKERPQEFRDMLTGAIASSRALGLALEKEPVNEGGATMHMTDLGASCVRCHDAFRN